MCVSITAVDFSFVFHPGKDWFGGEGRLGVGVWD